MFIYYAYLNEKGHLRFPPLDIRLAWCRSTSAMAWMVWVGWGVVTVADTRAGIRRPGSTHFWVTAVVRMVEHVSVVWAEWDCRPASSDVNCGCCVCVCDVCVCVCVCVCVFLSFKDFLHPQNVYYVLVCGYHFTQSFALRSLIILSASPWHPEVLPPS